jgi:hypothetical protein
MMISNIRISCLLFAGAVAFVGCKDPETMTTTSEATSTTGDSATSTSGSATEDPTATATATATATEGGTESATGTTTDVDPTGGTETTGCTFLSCMDGGAPDTNECDIWAQDCPDGEKCMPWANDGGGSWNALKCSPVDANPGQSGDECIAEGGAVSGVDNCDLGLLCWYVNEENIGSCIDQCTGTEEAPMCPSGTVCDVTNEGVLTLCLPTCDPLLVDCPGDQICFYSSLAGDFICDFDGSGEAGAYGDPCEYINVCDPGLFCANPENVPGCQAGGCCSEYCDINEENTCAGKDMGQECVPWFEMDAPPGLEHVGACVVP